MQHVERTSAEKEDCIIFVVYEEMDVGKNSYLNFNDRKLFSRILYQIIFVVTVSAWIFRCLIKVVWKELLHNYYICGYNFCVGRTSAWKESCWKKFFIIMVCVKMFCIMIVLCEEMLWGKTLHWILVTQNHFEVFWIKLFLVAILSS